MAAVIVLQERTPSGTVGARALRRRSLVPGVLYGDHLESRHFSIAASHVPKLHKAGGSSGLIDVQLGGDPQPVKAIVQHVERDPVSGAYEHIDLYQVRMDHKLHTEIALEFVGESSAVKDLGGVLVKQHAMLPIECLPADLVNHVAVPVGSLKTFDDAIRVRDLALPPGVVTHLPGDEIIASVAEPRSERELSELSSEVAAGEGPEVLTEKKEEAPEAAGGGAESEAKKGKA